jgi:hypothetical protein
MDIRLVRIYTPFWIIYTIRQYTLLSLCDQNLACTGSFLPGNNTKIGLPRTYEPLTRSTLSDKPTTDLQPPLWQEDPESDPERIFLPPHSLGARRADRQVLDQREDLYRQYSSIETSDFRGIADINPLFSM